MGGSAGMGGELTTCDDVRAAIADELTEIQACQTAAECGQVLTGTSCGCTRSLVARLDADTGRFEELLGVTVDGESCSEFISTCDCPRADGFVCSAGRCGWNYTAREECSPTEVGSLCVRGTPIDSGDALAVGQPLVIQVTPRGCHSSSCTRVVDKTCSITAAGEDFEAAASFCLAPTGDDACTADCGGGGFASCTSNVLLTEGVHTVRLGELSVTFTVPSVLRPGDECDSIADTE
jgi:hypothetical protein